MKGRNRVYCNIKQLNQKWTYLEFNKAIQTKDGKKAGQLLLSGLLFFRDIYSQFAK